MIILVQFLLSYGKEFRNPNYLQQQKAKNQIFIRRVQTKTV